MADLNAIHGSTDDERNLMIAGQFRKVFDPTWVQVFSEGLTVQFEDSDDVDEETLLRFADMNGYELRNRDDGTWTRYYFR